MIDRNKIRKRIREKLDDLVDHSYADGTVLFNLEKLSTVSKSVGEKKILDDISEILSKVAYEANVEV